jgi:hypothetical protein
MPPLPSACKEIGLTVRGQVKNAQNGGMMNGVTVSVEGTDKSSTTQDGFFTLAMKPGTAKLRYEKDGFILSTKTLNVMSDIAPGGISDVSMSPTMSDDQWRVVTKWGQTPSDIDSYLKWGSSKVCWYGRSSSSSGLSGLLEHDDTSSFGPETVYMTGVGNCRGGEAECDARFYVNDYGQTGKMLNEGVEVTLYTGSRAAGHWKIADCASSVSGNRNWWHVFTIDAKDNKVKWSCHEGASSAPSLTLLRKNASEAIPIKAPQQRLRARVA